MIDLRKMTDTELVKFNELCIDELSEVFSLSMPEDEAKKKAEEEQYCLLSEGVNTANHYLFTINQDKKNIGSIWFAKLEKKQKYIAFIFYIGIDKILRGKGFGTTAMKIVETDIKKIGLNTIRLHVLKNNSAAIKMYNKLGYSIYTDYEKYDIDDPGNIMEKVLQEGNKRGNGKYFYPYG